MEHVLEVKNLKTVLHTPKGDLTPIEGISFYIDSKEMLGIVGESGCGKSITVSSVMRLMPPNRASVSAESIVLDNQEIKDLSEKEYCRLRGEKMSMIFQEPMTSLNPSMRIVDQIAEPLICHAKCSKSEAKEKALQLLSDVGITDPQRVARDFPHSLSGGMRQRVVIAMAMICRPKVMFADEPTTALDVTIQAQILEMIKKLQEKEGMAVALVTHNLGIVAEYCDRVMVMYCGQVVESATVNELLDNPLHPYTDGLIKSIPKRSGAEGELAYINGTVLPVSGYQDYRGCRFAERCRFADDRCRKAAPPLFKVSSGHLCRCWLHQSEEEC